MSNAQRHKDPRTLGEPFRSWRNAELAIEKSRALFCYYLHKVLGRSLRQIAKEQGMSYERVRHLSERAQKVYGATLSDYGISNNTNQC